LNGERGLRPAEASWVVSVHLTASDFSPIGAGVVIDGFRVLTCGHFADRGADLWVAFPKCETDPAEGGLVPRRRVASVRRPAEQPGQDLFDLAVLVLAEQIPARVQPAALRLAKPQELVIQGGSGHPVRWWAFGFPGGAPKGNSAYGAVGEALGHGWVRLDTDAGTRYKIQPGFSGARIVVP
jgi:hypothetical protein